MKRVEFKIFDIFIQHNNFNRVVLNNYVFEYYDKQNVIQAICIVTGLANINSFYYINNEQEIEII